MTMPYVTSAATDLIDTGGLSFARGLSFTQSANTLHITTSGTGTTVLNNNVIQLLQRHVGEPSNAATMHNIRMELGALERHQHQTGIFGGTFDSSSVTGTSSTFDGSAITTYPFTANTAANVQIVGNHYQVTTSEGYVLYDSAWDGGGQMARSPALLDYRRRRTRTTPSRHLPPLPTLSPAEQKARDTLRDLLSEADWRGYLTNGFIVVRGPSGRRYQIFRDQRRTVVWGQGRQLATICIHTDAQCPPTDHVLNLKILVELDEDAVWAGGNVTMAA